MGPDNRRTLDHRFAQWFSSNTDPVFDQQLAKRFEHAVLDARRGKLDSWLSHNRGCLALILLLDQLPRNIYRGTKAAFNSDHKAFGITEFGIDQGFDRQLTLVERIFFYIPFEHAENLAAQQQCQRYYQMLDGIADPETKSLAMKCVAGSAEHLEVIRRFGRFPQRNAVLGRESTPEEIEWLGQHHGWGQKIEIDEAQRTST